MKFVIGIIIGCILGFLSLIAYSQLKGYLPQLPEINILNSRSEIFNDLNDGQILQKLEDLPDENFRSTNGNQASLFLLNNGMCKIKVEIIGETGFSNYVAYFKKDKLINLQQYEYRSSWMKPVDGNQSQSETLYFTQHFNLNSVLVKREFKNLVKKFNQEKIKKC
jgi:hypothetical protein